MRTIMSVCVCLVVSATAEARSRLKKILSEGEPGTCSEIGGLWEGECSDDGKPIQARLQIFQDGCTDIAFYDFDSSIPQAYKIGREATVQSMRFADAFVNFTVYANWSEDRRTFKINRLANSEYTLNGIIRGKLEETFTVAFKAGSLLETTLKGRVASSDRAPETYLTTCSYRRTN